ncbi:PVC-type heme-binding CxxCH protein [Flexithrix dorotheae]|uniref:PVC-type heme-binding CxxCH protein n=1 Tax=Flexithrix dorotheae TaxID=70993 RepID=UPI001FDFB894|nr:PVC-type heme-binding CxxCH protein [Flexithrix dorotheae]
MKMNKKIINSHHNMVNCNFYFPKLLPSFLVLLIGLSSCGSQPQEKSAPPPELPEAEKRKVENALVGLDVYDGLEATVFATEPMLVNPTNMDIDSKGRIWVCEAYNYRYELNPNNPTRESGDRILILEDTDGDGVADSRKVFYEGKDIDAALGIAVLGNKVIVSTSPNIWVFTDENGDDKPDKKELLFTGIGGIQHDHGVHSFIFGPDGKLYFNFGNAGEQVLDKDGKPIVDKAGNVVNHQGKPYRQGMIFRCNPDGSEFEVLAHNFRNNYEVAVDAFGTLWQSDNDDDGNKGVRINYVMEYGNYGYQDEMTGAGWRTIRTGMHEEIPKRHWHLNDPGVVPNLLQTGAGSPTGMVIYEGRLLPEVFWDQMIHSDAGPNVVRSYPVQKDGAGYKAEIVNILTGTRDSWFRPSDVCIAPDGSLFVADWYDPGVGGHQMGDQEQGRIYRIAPKGHAYKNPTLDLSSTEGTIAAMKSPNMATRYLGWNKLHNMGADAEEALKTEFTSENPRHKARALWLLAKIEGKTKHYVDQAINDENEDIRITGLRIAKQMEMPELVNYMEKLSKDNSPQIRREVAIATRFLDAPKAAEIWAEVAAQYPSEDRWYLEALGIGSDLRPDEFFAAYEQKVKGNLKSPEAQDIVWRTRAKASIPLLAEFISNPAITPEGMKRYFRAFDFHNDPSKDKVLVALIETDHPEKDQIIQIALNHISPSVIKNSPSTEKLLLSSLESVKGTNQYIEWVKRFDIQGQEGELKRLMLEETNTGVGVKATQLLREKKGVDYFQKLLSSDDDFIVSQTLTAMKHLGDMESWNLVKSYAFDENKELAVRKKAMQTLGTGWVQESRVLDMLVDNEIPEELKTTAVTVLMSAIKGSIREQASKYMKMPEGADKLPPLKELVATVGNIENGKASFDKFCAACHQVNGEGIDFGPKLSEIGSKLSKDGLYAAIIYPNEGISFGYEGFVIETKDGSKSVGYIASKTEDEIGLKQMGGMLKTFKTSEVVSIEELENSLMTSGLHLAMSKDELVDLVEYLSSLKKAEGLASK